jgi:hypothetical protein
MIHNATNLTKPLIVLVLIFAAGCSWFGDDKSYSISVVIVPEEAGEVLGTGVDFAKGDVVELMAQPHEYWVFERWSGDFDGTSNPVVFTVSKSLDIAAHFVRRPYPLTVNIEGEGTYEARIVSHSKPEEVPYGTVVQLRAIPAPGWRLAWWNADVNMVSEEILVTIEGPTEIWVSFYEEPQFELITQPTPINARESRVEARFTHHARPFQGVGYVEHNNGIVWSARPMPDLTDSYESIVGSGIGKLRMIELEPDTRYYYRFYTTSQVATFYSDEYSFTTPRYHLGGTGPAGGIIFYIDTFNNYDFDYIEVVPDNWYGDNADESAPRMPWGCSGMRLIPPGTYTSIADGRARTMDIAAACDEESPAKVALQSTFGGFTDWYLPSSQELGHLYYNLRDIPFSLPINPNHSIWSSSELSATEVNLRRLSSGLPVPVQKIHEYPVYPVRVFSE